MGGAVVENLAGSTDVVVVPDSFRLTLQEYKLLKMHTSVFVNESWVRDSRKAGKLLPTNKYLCKGFSGSILQCFHLPPGTKIKVELPADRQIMEILQELEALGVHRVLEGPSDIILTDVTVSSLDPRMVTKYCLVSKKSQSSVVSHPYLYVQK